MQKTIILRGLSGSGKTSWSRSFVTCCPDHSSKWVRINRDDLRNMRGKYLLQEQEPLITKWQNALIEQALKSGLNVVVDNTNLKQSYVNELVALCTEYGDVETKVFNVSVDDCIKRDAEREHKVGEAVIRDQAKRFDVSKMKAEFFPMKGKVEPIKQDTSLTPICLVDLDGTLCIHNNRGPFEYDKCDTDLVNEPIRYIIYAMHYAELKIIFMSGREGTAICKEKTYNWLKEHLGFYDITLFMRQEGDFRKDAIVKKELFDKHIKDKYYVEFVLDDRKQVVDMWRQLGLTCLQVADGDF